MSTGPSLLVTVALCRVSRSDEKVTHDDRDRACVPAGLFDRCGRARPGLSALIARVLARGPVGIAPFIAGFVVGDLVWVAVAVAGMAALADTLGSLFILLRFAGAAYLLFVAFKLVTASPEPVDLAVEHAPGSGATREFGSSLLLTLGNPKVILFSWRCCPACSNCQSSH